MPKKAVELSALSVRRLTEPGLHFVGGVAGLALQVAPSGARTWVLRATMGGRRRDMGLGGFPDVELAAARDKAREARALIDEGVDPIGRRRELKRKALDELAREKTFSECSRAYIDAKSAEWSNSKHAAQWTNTLKTYAAPVLGNMRVRDIALRDVVRVLEPIWTTKTETATRVRARIEAVLAWAAVNGYREDPNPATWRGRLDQVLPKPAKFARVEHHKAVAVKDLPAFYERLKKQDGIGARALQFAILTAARSGEVRGATWSEIDFDRAEWVIPADRMKAGKEHRVPLSRPALRLLGRLPRSKDAEFVFTSVTSTKPLSDMTLSAVMRRMNADAVPHGFRSTFKDWATELTGYRSEVVEKALAHAIADKVEAAYRRGDLFALRRNLMAEWAEFCESAVRRVPAQSPVQGE